MIFTRAQKDQRGLPQGFGHWHHCSKMWWKPSSNSLTANKNCQKKRENLWQQQFNLISTKQHTVLYCTECKSSSLNRCLLLLGRVAFFSLILWEHIEREKQRHLYSSEKATVTFVSYQTCGRWVHKQATKQHRKSHWKASSKEYHFLFKKFFKAPPFRECWKYSWLDNWKCIPIW